MNNVFNINIKWALDDGSKGNLNVKRQNVFEMTEISTSLVRLQV